MSDQQDKGWLDPKAAEGQLLLARETLQKPMWETPHFQAFLDMMKHIMGGCSCESMSYSLLDVGCGVGAYAALVDRFFPHISYRGCDISPHMIEIARREFDPDFGRGRGSRFTVRDVLDLRSGADIILASSLIEVCPNWRDVLRHLCSLQFKWLILNRVRLWNDPDHPTTEQVYATIYETSSFEAVHNWETLRAIAREAGVVNTHTIAYQVEPETQLVCLLFEREGE
jgi:SAM-dependent methyltransferase